MMSRKPTAEKIKKAPPLAAIPEEFLVSMPESAATKPKKAKLIAAPKEVVTVALQETPAPVETVKAKSIPLQENKVTDEKEVQPHPDTLEGLFATLDLLGEEKNGINQQSQKIKNQIKAQYGITKAVISAYQKVKSKDREVWVGEQVGLYDLMHRIEGKSVQGELFGTVMAKDAGKMAAEKDTAASAALSAMDAVGQIN